jgi:hypothetical protein
MLLILKNLTMKNLVLFTGILIMSIRSFAQEFKESDLDKLHLLPGKVNTYCSKGSETKAKYLQELVQDAVIFYQNKLQDTFDIKLLVLNKSDWKSFVGGPYFLYDFAVNPDRIEMGINEIYKIKLPDYKTLYGKNVAFYWDFAAVHELGHYIARRNNAVGMHWKGEFFADYIQLGFLIEKIPDWHLNTGICRVLFKYLPVKYKTLEDFEKNYSRMGPVNMLLYHTKLLELAYKIFKKRGWTFMYQYLDRYKIKETTLDRNLYLQKTISDFKEMEPEIFNDWILGMKKTSHPFIVLCILIGVTVALKFQDNSFNIFTEQGLKTKKRYRIFGVPTILIISKFRSIDSQKIKRKLKLIIGLRPVMYLCFVLSILLLILNH